MTGQGDKNYERIKNARKQSATIDVSKQFRTANGLQVRGLQVHRTNKLVVNGKEITTAYHRYYIAGQIYTQHQWLPAEWNEKGVHPQEEFNLVEVKQDVEQGKLF